MSHVPPPPPPPPFETPSLFDVVPRWDGFKLKELRSIRTLLLVGGLALAAGSFPLGILFWDARERAKAIGEASDLLALPSWMFWFGLSLLALSQITAVQIVLTELRDELRERGKAAPLDARIEQ